MFWALQINVVLWNTTAYYITVLEILGAVGLASMFDTFHCVITVTKICSKRRNGSWCRNSKRGKRICGVKRVSQIAPQHGQRACACLWEHIHCAGDTVRVGAKALNKS